MTENVCVARWAARDPQRTGSPCGMPATYTAGDVEVCFLHYERLKVWAASLIPHATGEAITGTAAVYREHMELERGRAEEAGRIEIDRAICREQAEARRGVVYYLLRDSDGLIKIGTSRRGLRRLSDLKREHGPCKLMAAEYGGYLRENQIHKRFLALWVQGEWFRPELPLLKHVAGLRRNQLQAGALNPDLGLEDVVAMIHALGGEWAPPNRRGPQKRAA